MVDELWSPLPEESEHSKCQRAVSENYNNKLIDFETYKRQLDECPPPPPFLHAYVAEHKEFFELTQNELDLTIGLDGLDHAIDINHTEATTSLQYIRDAALALLAVKLGVHDAQELDKFPQLKALAETEAVAAASGASGIASEVSTPPGGNIMKWIGKFDIAFGALQYEYIFSGMNQEQRAAAANDIISRLDGSLYIEPTKKLLDELVNIDNPQHPKPLLAASDKIILSEFGLTKEFFAQSVSYVLEDFANRRTQALSVQMQNNLVLQDGKNSIYGNRSYGSFLLDVVNGVLDNIPLPPKQKTQDLVQAL